ncbi:MAG TPA: SPFH domain-containing protein [Bacteroidia bacterium]|jgi:regulator of protease activity HflC (stomatin/prohibitin superfamily)
MISLVIFGVALILALGVALKVRGLIRTEGRKVLVKPALILFTGILLALIQPYEIERVDAGHVGIKVNLTGDARGVSTYEYKTGWVTFNTWTEDLFEFPTFQQHIEYADQIVITKGGFVANIKPTFNYALVPGAVGDMFQNLRLDVKQIEDGWLKTAIVGAVADVANRWTVDDVFNEREKFEAAIVAECNKRVSKWFTVSQLRTNIVPPPALQKAIEDKTVAIQDVQKAQSRKLVEIALGDQRVALARADSAFAVIQASGKAQAAIIEADGEAQAMKKKKQELTPLYIEYIKVSTWNGINPTTVLGSGNSTMVQVK